MLVHSNAAHLAVVDCLQRCPVHLHGNVTVTVTRQAWTTRCTASLSWLDPHLDEYTYAYLCLLMPVSCRVVAGTAALPLALLAVAVCCSWLHLMLFSGVCLLLVAVLNKKSGLLGVSGHNDLRTIIELKVRNCQLLLRNVLLRVRPNQSNLIRS